MFGQTEAAGKDPLFTIFSLRAIARPFPKMQLLVQPPAALKDPFARVQTRNPIQDEEPSVTSGGKCKFGIAG